MGFGKQRTPERLLRYNYKSDRGRVGIIMSILLTYVKLPTAF